MLAALPRHSFPAPPGRCPARHHPCPPVSAAPLTLLVLLLLADQLHHLCHRRRNLGGPRRQVVDQAEGHKGGVGRLALDHHAGGRRGGRRAGGSAAGRAGHSVSSAAAAAAAAATAAAAAHGSTAATGRAATATTRSQAGAPAARALAEGLDGLPAGAHHLARAHGGDDLQTNQQNNEIMEAEQTRVSGRVCRHACSLRTLPTCTRGALSRPLLHCGVAC